MPHSTKQIPESLQCASSAHLDTVDPFNLVSIKLAFLHLKLVN